jgi:hypothetical protein
MRRTWDEDKSDKSSAPSTSQLPRLPLYGTIQASSMPSKYHCTILQIQHKTSSNILENDPLSVQQPASDQALLHPLDVTQSLMVRHGTGDARLVIEEDVVVAFSRDASVEGRDEIDSLRTARSEDGSKAADLGHMLSYFRISE